MACTEREPLDPCEITDGDADGCVCHPPELHTLSRFNERWQLLHSGVAESRISVVTRWSVRHDPESRTNRGISSSANSPDVLLHFGVSMVALH